MSLSLFPSLFFRGEGVDYEYPMKLGLRLKMLWICSYFITSCIFHLWKPRSVICVLGSVPWKCPTPFSLFSLLCSLSLSLAIFPLSPLFKFSSHTCEVIKNSLGFHGPNQHMPSSGWHPKCRKAAFFYGLCYFFFFLLAASLAGSSPPLATSPLELPPATPASLDEESVFLT